MSARMSHEAKTTLEGSSAVPLTAEWAGWLSKRAEELERRKNPQWLAVAKIAAQARKKAGVKS